jgi:ABC-type transport system involved in cytochrome bd biosynthesis fused ATPase/permease subunit
MNCKILGQKRRRGFYLSIVVVSVIAIFISSCAPPKEKITENAIEAVEKRASFDMECDEVSSQSLSGVNLYDNAPGSVIAETIIGVTGCGKKSSYKTTCINIYQKKMDCVPVLNSIKD